MVFSPAGRLSRDQVILCLYSPESAFTGSSASADGPGGPGGP